MTYDDILSHYKNDHTLAASKIGVTTATLYNWRKRGIPYKSQLMIEAASKSKLKADKQS